MGRAFDWLFRDRRTGAVVIGQWPNLPLWLFALAAASSWILSASRVAAPDWLDPGLRLVAAACLTWWALDELLRGVNPWRRCLGAAALVFVLWRVVGSF